MNHLKCEINQHIWFLLSTYSSNESAVCSSYNCYTTGSNTIYYIKNKKFIDSTHVYTYILIYLYTYVRIKCQVWINVTFLTHRPFCNKKSLTKTSDPSQLGARTQYKFRVSINSNLNVTPHPPLASSDLESDQLGETSAIWRHSCFATRRLLKRGDWWDVSYFDRHQFPACFLAILFPPTVSCVFPGNAPWFHFWFSSRLCCCRSASGLVTINHHWFIIVVSTIITAFS